jgi:hypothetical protein
MMPAKWRPKEMPMAAEIIFADIAAAGLVIAILQISVKLLLFWFRREPIEPFPTNWSKAMKLAYLPGQMACGLIGLAAWWSMIRSFGSTTDSPWRPKRISRVFAECNARSNLRILSCRSCKKVLASCSSWKPTIVSSA